MTYIYGDIRAEELSVVTVSKLSSEGGKEGVIYGIGVFGVPPRK